MKKLHSVLSIFLLMTVMCSCINNETGAQSTLSNPSSVSAPSASDTFASELAIINVTCVLDDEMVSDAIIVDENKAVLLIESETDMLVSSPKRIVLYDFSKEKVLKETTVICSRPKLFEYKNGVYITGDDESNGNHDMPVLVAFDYKLNETYAADFSKVKITEPLEEARLSYDGETIAFSTYFSSIYLAQKNSVENASLLYSASSKQEVNRLITFDFTESADAICFTCKLVSSNDTINGIGWVLYSSSQGSGTSSHSVMQSEALICEGNKALVLDEAAAFGSASSGICTIRNFETGKYQSLRFENKNESSNAVLSNHGRYVLSCVEGKSEDGLGMLRFSFYDSDNLKKVKSFDYKGKTKDVTLSIMVANEENGWAYVKLNDGGSPVHLRLSMPNGD